MIKNIMVSVADRCCTKARGVVGMHTERKVSTATADRKDLDFKFR